MNFEKFEEIRKQLAYSVIAERRYGDFLRRVGIVGPKLQESQNRLSLRCYYYNQFCLDNPDRGLEQGKV